MGLLIKDYQPQFNKFKLGQRMKEHSLRNSQLTKGMGRASLKNPPKKHLVNNKKK